jgi:hypothetical protein
MSDTSPGPGWWQAADLKWYPPEQHAKYVPPPSAPPPPPPPSAPPPGPGQPAAPHVQGGQYAGAGGSGITFDLPAILPGGLIVLVGAFLYCVFGFFPWYTINIDCGLVPAGVPCAVNYNAWRSGTAVFSAIVFLLAAGVFVVKALRGIPAPKLPLEMIALGAVALGDLFFLIAFFSVPAGSFGFGRGWGLWIDLLVVLGINAGAVLQFLLKGGLLKGGLRPGA